MSNSVLTMIVRHGTKESTVAYTLISADYQTTTIDANKLKAEILAKRIVVTNLTVENGKIVGSNGALDKYTLINSVTGAPEGTTRAVILDRIEENNKLVGYTVFTQNGSIANLTVAQAADLCNRKLISNGKIRHTDSGDIVSAIGGNYPLRQIKIDKAPAGSTSVELLFFGSIVDTDAYYFGAIITCTSAAQMAKLTKALSNSNAKVIEAAVQAGGQKVRDSLAIRRFGATGIYGVFEVSALKKLIDNKAAVSNKIGSIAVSAIEYTADKEPNESIVKVDKAFKVVDKDEKTSKGIAQALKYASKIKDIFNGVTIQ